MSDLSLRKTILEELEFKPEIDAAHIGVAVDNGVVTLSGHVNSYAQKVSAERAVKGIKGVRAVADEIQVRLEKGAGTADDTIATRALNIIKWSADVPDGDIKVIVQNGRITLEGEVDWQYQKEAAERAVRKLSGVVGVDNRLSLVPRVDVVDIQHRIEEALKRNAEVDAKEIHVRVDGDVVRLEGKVHLMLKDRIVVLMAGRAAEYLAYGQISTGAADDLARATDIARQLITRFGMSTELGQSVLERQSATYLGERMQGVGEKDYSEQTAREVDLGIRALLDEAFGRAKALLASRRGDLDAGAHLLVEKETLTPEEFPPLMPIKPAPLSTPLTVTPP